MIDYDKTLEELRAEAEATALEAVEKAEAHALTRHSTTKAFAVAEENLRKAKAAAAFLSAVEKVIARLKRSEDDE